MYNIGQNKNIKIIKNLLTNELRKNIIYINPT